LPIFENLNGCEIYDDEDFYIRIWSLKECLELNEVYGFKNYMSEFYAIGDNGGDHVLIYLNKSDKVGLYLMSVGNIGEEDAIFISRSLHELLDSGIGVDILENS
jgi:hypothetical protein